jgi:K(+)-stimulated pyrophosphate-energized sodium pump
LRSIIPIVVGLVFGVAGVMGLLLGGLTSRASRVAIFMANSRRRLGQRQEAHRDLGKVTAQEIVDNPQTQERLPRSIRAELVNRAQLAVNSGHADTIIYGKGSEDHKAGVVGDTVGDPFKDTSGPSLNILIKLMSMVSVVFAGLIVKFAPVIGELLGISG